MVLGLDPPPLKRITPYPATKAQTGMERKVLDYWLVVIKVNCVRG